ncbi:electron transport protein [Enterobacter cloacae]|uniref:Electron transport protein n=1 Tax=Enterobacter cloacae TaxID=550 RepID=A0A377LU91_ENTCL|nr:electron transport protein [Enterobacter cloacae]
MNRFIMADASKCIGCRTCEVACVVSHQAEQDCASLTPETFLPRIHVIKGVNISTARYLPSVRRRAVRQRLP